MGGSYIVLMSGALHQSQSLHIWPEHGEEGAPHHKGAILGGQPRLCPRKHVLSPSRPGTTTAPGVMPSNYNISVSVWWRVCSIASSRWRWHQHERESSSLPSTNWHLLSGPRTTLSALINFKIQGNLENRHRHSAFKCLVSPGDSCRGAETTLSPWMSECLSARWSSQKVRCQNSLATFSV